MMQSKGFCGVVLFGNVIPGKRSKEVIRKGEWEADLGGCNDNHSDFQDCLKLFSI